MHPWLNRESLSYAGIGISIVLLGLKTWAGIMSGSIAVLSDALNSFLDVFSYAVIAASVRVQHKSPDRMHPYGHYRAEPLAGFIVAVMAALLGVSIIKDAIEGLVSGDKIAFSRIPLIVLVISSTIKILMSKLYASVGKTTRSAALLAASIDSRNDVLASLTALAGFTLKGLWDGIAGIAIGVWILYSGIKMGIENSGYLLGTSPGDEFSAKVRERALEVSGVSAINDIRAHYVGSFIHLEVHIEVLPDLRIQEAHDIGEIVQKKILELDDVGEVFVHIDVLDDPVRISL